MKFTHKPIGTFIQFVNVHKLFHLNIILCRVMYIILYFVKKKWKEKHPLYYTYTLYFWYYNDIILYYMVLSHQKNFYRKFHWCVKISKTLKKITSVVRSIFKKFQWVFIEFKSFFQQYFLIRWNTSHKKYKLLLAQRTNLCSLLLLYL